MNQTTRYVMDIYQVSVIVRDTLEYLIQKKDGYNADVYKQRKEILKLALTENHPFSRFLANNNEMGEKVRQNMTDFFDLIYGDESRAVFLENDKVVVDNGYATQILDYVVGLHETIYEICLGFIKNSKENNTYEESFERLINKENAMYRCVASLVITDHIHHLFVEFNKVMHESKGQSTPQSNFIGNELNKNVGFFGFVDSHANYDDDIYKLAVQKTKFVIDCMGGKEKIDDTGEGLRKEILNLHELWTKAVVLTENDWRAEYQREVSDLINYDKEMRSNQEKVQEEAKEETTTELTPEENKGE